MATRVVFESKGRATLSNFPVPAPSDTEVTVRTLYSLMSIGTETTILHARYAPDSHFAARFAFPQLKTGVQAVGEIIARGAAVSEFACGDRVFMRMAHTSHWTLPAEACSRVPDQIDTKSACWCGLAKTAFRTAHAAPFCLGEAVLIVGAGPVGQMAIRWARAAGMACILVIDIHAARLEHAVRGGASECLAGSISDHREALQRLSSSAGFKLVVDATGSAAVFAQAQDVAACYGKLVVLGDSGFPTQQCLTSAVMTRGLTIVATHDHHDRDGWTQRRIDQLFFQLATSGRFELDGLITHEFRPEDCAQAYELADQRRDSAMGILFDWTRHQRSVT